MIGPYKLGMSIKVRCEVTGGSPKPRISWLKNDKMLDDSIDESSQDISVNVLEIYDLKREDMGSLLVCQAENTNLTDPLTTAVILDIYGEHCLYPDFKATSKVYIYSQSRKYHFV